MRERLLAKRHILFFAIFMVMHTVTCFFTNYFGDDYYYAAFIRNGGEYFISENVFHYLNTNGRALVHIVDELLLGIDFNLWRISSVLMMALLGLLLAKLSSRQYRADADREEYKNAMIIALSLLSVTDIAILRQSFYWATGALNYLFPATLTLLYIYLARRAYEREGGFIPLIPLALVGAATTEQASAALLLGIIWLGITAVIEKKWKLIPPMVGNFAAAAAGITTILFAPGSRARTLYYPDFFALSLPERVIHNARELMRVVFGADGIYGLIIVAMVIVIFRSYRRIPVLSVVSMASLAAYIFLLMSGTDISDSLLLMAFFFVPIIAVMVYTIWDYFKNGERDNLYFVMSAVAMQCAMAISPEFGPRTLTMTLVLLIVPITRALADCRSNAVYAVLAGLAASFIPKNLTNINLYFILAVIVILLAFAMKKYFRFPIVQTLAALCAAAELVTVPIGYAENIGTLAQNRRQIEMYNPAAGEPLKLYYLPNHTHKYTMPYDDPYHEYVLLKLCGLPTDTEVVYGWAEE